MTKQVQQINEVLKDKKAFLLNNKVEVLRFSYDLSSLFVKFTMNGVKLELELNDFQIEKLLPYDANITYFDTFNISEDNRFLTYAEYFEGVSKWIILDFVAVHFVTSRQALAIIPLINYKQSA